MCHIKCCERCLCVISNIHLDDDYYRHLSVKYCDECRKIVKRDQAAERMKRLRERKKQEKKLMQTKIDILTAENKIMLENYLILCEHIDKIKKYAGVKMP